MNDEKKMKMSAKPMQTTPDVSKEKFLVAGAILPTLLAKVSGAAAIEQAVYYTDKLHEHYYPK